MNVEALRRLVEEEVSRALGGARGRPGAVTEEMVVAARRRGAGALEHPPGALVTPAARERARDLRIEIRETPGAVCPVERRRVVEAVMAAVLARLRGRPNPRRARSWGQDSPVRAPRRGRPLVTAEAVRAAAAAGEPLRAPRGAILTPGAADEAARLGVRIDRS